MHRRGLGSRRSLGNRRGLARGAPNEATHRRCLGNRRGDPDYATHRRAHINPLGVGQAQPWQRNFPLGDAQARPWQRSSKDTDLVEELPAGRRTDAASLTHQGTRRLGLGSEASHWAPARPWSSRLGEAQARPRQPAPPRQRRPRIGDAQARRSLGSGAPDLATHRRLSSGDPDEAAHRSFPL